MNVFLKNWQTTLAGVLVITMAALNALTSVHVPGALDLPSAVIVGLGLIVAQDAGAFKKS